MFLVVVDAGLGIPRIPNSYGELRFIAGSSANGSLCPELPMARGAAQVFSKYDASWSVRLCDARGERLSGVFPFRAECPTADVQNPVSEPPAANQSLCRRNKQAEDSVSMTLPGSLYAAARGAAGRAAAGGPKH